MVGAGFAGLYMLHRLRGLGLKTRVFEAGDGIGGTWFWNRYPGARCDIESVEYSYSFSPELQQEWQWSERYSSQPEILRYLEHVADRFDLRRDIQLETLVVSAVFDDAAGRWTITTDGGDQVTTKYFITAVGCLSTPNIPDIPGLDSFAGPMHHTGQWPGDGVDVAGKTVAVIGTGSSGIQVIPELARQARQLTVFQRTPHFSVPARNHALEESQRKEVKADYDGIRKRARESAFGASLLDDGTRPAGEFSPEEQRAELERRWQRGGLTVLVGFADVLLKDGSNEVVAEFVRSKIREMVKDPAVADKLIPHGYPIGCRRLCLDTDYYKTFNRDNVTLVNLHETPIENITPSGLRYDDSDHDVDVLVLATGFDAMTGAFNKIDIRGRGGASLRDKWAGGPRAYLGLMVEGFPNLFTITGPLSPSVLSNMVTSIEQHVEWIAGAIGHMEGNQIATAEAEAEAEAEWTAHAAMVAGFTVYTSEHCNSWYLGSNVPGKERTFTPYIGGVGPYAAKLDEVADKGYEGLSFKRE